MSLPIYERFRPSTWGEVIGQPKALKTLDTVRRVNGSLAGQVFWIYGPYGTGKTSIARLIMAEVSLPFWTEEKDGQEIDIATIERWEDGCRYSPGEGRTHGYIVNEAQNLRPAIVSRLQTTLERRWVQQNGTFAFTTPIDPKKFKFDKADGAGLLSRKISLKLSSQGLLQLFAVRAKEIAGILGLDGQDIAKYERVVKDCHNNMREVLQIIGSGGMEAAQ